MNSGLTRGVELILELADAVARVRGNQNATLNLSSDSSFHSIGLEKTTDRDLSVMVQNMQEQVNCLPVTAFPVMISVTPAGTDLYLGGACIHESELEDTLRDFSIVEDALLDVPRGQETSYAIGLSGRLNPNTRHSSIIATSPLEAVMKFAMTKVALSEMEEILADDQDVKATDMEMRSRHDWARYDFASLFDQACQRINAVIRDSDPELSPS
ncbi:hypothetical protein KUV57_13710 [Epibacterium sp. DP7N7-1]|nr:hypothetical protein [Epibacterium sp. DP7N7-1]